MQEPANGTQFARFGAFEVNFVSGELRKHGVRLKVQEQPFQVLELLLARPGELVTRETIQQKLWPSGTFVDFENGLNTAINRLREALGDSAENPRFIVTEPRRGYRFIAPVDGRPRLEPDSPSLLERLLLGSGFKRSLMASMVTVAALAAVGIFYIHRAPKLAGNHSILVADFTNTTGDPVFDGTLRQGLAVQLEQSPFLNPISDQRIQQTLRLMGQPSDARLTPEISMDLCQRTGGDAVLNGSVAQIGVQYLLTLRAVNCVSGDSLASTEAQASDKDHVLDALGKTASEIRNKLGESLNSVQKYATPLVEATTPSLEALKAYDLARKTQFAKGDTAALPFYNKAVELDPNFAILYAAMSLTYANLNEVDRSAQYARKAYELREKVSERERFYIEGNYYLLATGEYEKAAHIYDLWLQTYPRDEVPYRRLAFAYCSLGELEKCLEQAQEAVRLEPNNGKTYQLLGNAYMNLNRLSEAEDALNQAEGRKLATKDLLLFRYLLAFLKGDAVQMSLLFSAAMGTPGTEDVMLADKADTEGWYGKLKNANELTRRAMDSAAHNDANETAATYQVAAALREAESGIRKQAHAEATAALRLAPNHDVQAMAALAFARAGDKAGAERLAADVAKRFPIDTLIQRYWLPTIRAAVALERNDPNRGIKLLKAANGVELSQPTYINVYLCPVYLRGEAYLMLHDGNAAAAEFQKFFDHRGLVVNFPWGALAHLGLARAYAMQGDTGKAKAAYQDFLTLWKDADPDIPIFIAAKAEYAKLQ
jgi:DNA-binding winged helix-turn-helix (wHTH) protein/predicted Zn-dependent protease